MKKFFLCLLTCGMLLSLMGCGNSATETTAPSETIPETTHAPTEAPEETTEPAATEPDVEQVTGYTMTTPDGFSVDTAEDDLTIYVSPNSPRDDSRIEVEVHQRDLTVLELDEDGFMALYPEIEDFRRITALEQTEVDGFPALFIDYTYRVDSDYTHVYEYHVIADQTYLFRFSDTTSGNDWLDLYAEAAATINMLTMDEHVVLDYSGLEKYELDCGISLYAVEGMEEQNAPGFTACIGSRKAIILVLEDNKEEHALEDLTLEEYAALVSQANDLDEFALDNYGNLCVDFYSTDADGVEYYNNLTVKEIGDSFWVFQMTCAADDQAAYAREFSIWATSIE